MRLNLRVTKKKNRNRTAAAASRAATARSTKYGQLTVSVTDHAEHGSSTYFRHQSYGNLDFPTATGSGSLTTTTTSATLPQQRRLFQSLQERELASAGGSALRSGFAKSVLAESRIEIVVPKASMSSNVEQKMNQFCTEKLIQSQRRLSKLYGRDHELRVLRQQLDQLTSTTGTTSTTGKHRALIQLSGLSGQGKTALALQLQEPAEKRGCFFVMGKFDLANMGQPYSGIKTALAQLIREKILDGLPAAKLKKLQEELCNKMTWEIDLLCQLIPDLALLVEPIQQNDSICEESPCIIPEDDNLQPQFPPSTTATNATANRPTRTSNLGNHLTKTRSIMGLQRTMTMERGGFANISISNHGSRDSDLGQAGSSHHHHHHHHQSNLRRGTLMTKTRSIMGLKKTLTMGRKGFANSNDNNSKDEDISLGSNHQTNLHRGNLAKTRSIMGLKRTLTMERGGFANSNHSREDTIKEETTTSSVSEKKTSILGLKRKLTFEREEDGGEVLNDNSMKDDSRKSDQDKPTSIFGLKRTVSLEQETAQGTSSLSSQSNLQSQECTSIQETDEEEDVEKPTLNKPKKKGGRVSRKHRISMAGNRGSLRSSTVTNRTPRKKNNRSRDGGGNRGSLRSSVASRFSRSSTPSSTGLRSSIASSGGSRLSTGTSVLNLRRTHSMERNESNASMLEDSYPIGGAGGADRLQFALRKLINIISSFAPLILVCDDTQWADSDSMNLLKGWITDDGNPRLITIWIYRKNLVGPDHFVTKSTEEVETLQQERSITICKINVGQLKTEDVNEMISDTLDLEPSKTNELTRIMQQKTNGNVFFISQYLQSLAQKGLLMYQMATMSWDWDLEEIRNGCSATENVADLMKEKLEQSLAARKLLPLAACIGATFDVRVLQAVLQGLRESKERAVVMIFLNALGKEVQQLLIEDGTQLLERVEKEGLIEVAGANEFSFIHDKVIEGALALVDEGMLEDLKFAMGYLLLQQLEHLEEQWVEDALFLVVNLLNSRLDMIPPTRQLDVCELNLMAGDKAFLAAAYSCSAVHYGAAIRLLPQDHWSMLYDASLHLYISAAESEMCLGQYEKMKNYVNVVLELDCPLLDKLPAYKVLHDAHIHKCEVPETMNLIEDVLQQLGFHFPKSGIAAKTLAALVKMKMKKKMWKPDALSALPVSTNPLHEAISQMHGIFLGTVLMAKPEAFPLAIIMACRHVLDHGLTRYSAIPLAWLGVVITNAHGDYQWAKEHMEFTQSLLQRLPNRRIEARVNGTMCLFLNHWTAPIHSSIKPLIASYSRGMETCDFEVAFWSAHFFLEASVYAGKNLALLQKDAETYCKQAVDYGLNKHAECLRCFWQLMLNLRGCSDNTSVLTGTVHDEATVLETIEQTKDFHHLGHLQKDRLLAAAIFGEYEKGAELGMSSIGVVCKALCGQHSTLVARFVVGLCCFEMANRTKKKKKYLKAGTKQLKVIQSWFEKGNPNAQHYLLFLKAEKAVCDGMHDKALSLYERTILLSGRSGYSHDCALASERLATYFLELGDKPSARLYFQDSLRLYDEWGASKKVELLMAKMASLFPLTEE